MIVEDVRLRDLRGQVERSARVRWPGGDERLLVTMPAELAAAGDDGSPELAACLLLAMWADGELRLDARVSPLLHERAEEIQALYRAWDPQLPGARVETGGTASPKAPAGRDTACLLSRGVDSLYSAASRRDLSRLVYIDGLYPFQDAAVRAEERRLAGEAASRLGQPLACVSTNVRGIGERIVEYWEDHFGAALAYLGLALAGGIERLVIPSGDSYATVEPCGTSPLLDPLFSTEATAIEHDSLARGRVAKVAWLARERPDLLPLLKVCLHENRPDNCGRCGKCLLTMAALDAAGALREASGFPDAIDTDLVAGVRQAGLQDRTEWLEAARHSHDPALRRAITRGLAHSADEDTLVQRRVRHFRANRGRAERALLAGLPYPSLDGTLPGPATVGLLRLIDREVGRHRYAAGRIPRLELVGELGALAADPDDGDTPLWVAADGRVCTGAYRPPAFQPSRGTLLRWVLAPLAWRGFAPLPGRAAAAVRRASECRRRMLTAREGAPHPEGPPAGFLYGEPSPRRVALYASDHPVTGDQLLSHHRWEASDMGYVGTTLLGYLDARAPLTGRFGAGRPVIPWASRFGQAARRH